MIARPFLVALPALLILASACGPAPGYYYDEPGTTAIISTTPGGVAYVDQPATIVTATESTVVTIEVFYEELAPYGTWFDMEPYGRVWAAADTTYEPYEAGYWEYTEYGFTWIAETEWGWATEHYGRWVWATDQWIWLPDEEWGPAWVEWRDAETMIGWAPLGPDDWHTIPPVEHWVFVDVSYIFAQDIHEYYEPPVVVGALWDRSARVSWTTGASGHAYSPGPSAGSLRDRRVTVRQRGANTVYVGRSRPAAGGRSARPSVRVRGGARPRIAVDGTPRARVRVDGTPRARVRVNGPGRAAVLRTPALRPSDSALSTAARRRWTRPRPAARPARTRVIGARTPDAPHWETGAYGHEATNSEVRAAVQRAQRYERQRQVAPAPLAPRPTGPTPGVTVTRRQGMPSIHAEASRRPTPPPIHANTATVSPRTPNVAARPSVDRRFAPPQRHVPRPSTPSRFGRRPPTVQPSTPSRFGRRAPTVQPSTASRLGRRAPTRQPSGHSRFDRHPPSSHRSTSFGRSVASPPARPAAPAAQRQSPGGRTTTHQAPRVNGVQPPSNHRQAGSTNHRQAGSTNHRQAGSTTQHLSPVSRGRSAAPPVHAPGVGTAVRRH